MAGSAPGKTIRTTLLFCAFLAQMIFLGRAGLIWFFMGNRPEETILRQGFVDPITNKGRTVFVTQGESLALTVLEWGLLVLLVAGVLSWAIERRRNGAVSTRPLSEIVLGENRATVSVMKALLLLEILIVILVAIV